MNYHNRRFRAVSNSDSGQVDQNTVFHYRQEGDVLWGTYRGGSIRFGTLTGLVAPDGTLSFAYQHVDLNGEVRSGRCNSTPEILDNGLVRLHEEWQWTSGEAGSSVIDEIVP